jgi:phosphatidylglycerol---prolipoprotein diacylglyceryl transferase
VAGSASQYRIAAREMARAPLRLHYRTMIDFTPDPVFFVLGPFLGLGPFEVRWYGIGYVAAILAGAWLATFLARRRGERLDVIVDGVIVIAVTALIGGRAYHVIDQWAYYSQHLTAIFLPPYSGLGIYGGLATGTLGVIWYARRNHVSFWRWGDILAPVILVAQAVGRLGNFMNQELYGPPTNLPWGIAIQCQYRVAQYACPAGSDPTATLGQHFTPLFAYESLWSLVGIGVMLFLWSRFTARGRWLVAGDVGLLYFVWYGVERSVLESLRGGWNWVFPIRLPLFSYDMPMAQIVGLGAAAVSIVAIVIRHRYVRSHPESGRPFPPPPGPEPAAVADQPAPDDGSAAPPEATTGEEAAS